MGELASGGRSSGGGSGYRWLVGLMLGLLSSGGCSGRVDGEPDHGSTSGVGGTGGSIAPGSGDPITEYYCGPAADFHLTVCSGPVVVDETGLALVEVPKASGTAGEGGLGGGSSSSDTIVVVYEACLGRGGYEPFVAPGQEVLMLSSWSSACDESSLSPTVADHSGRLSSGSGFVHIVIPADEFECFYLSSVGDPERCAQQ